jgi:hypothetical protein
LSDVQQAVANVLPPHADNIAAPLPAVESEGEREPFACASNCTISSSVQVWNPSDLILCSLMPSVGFSQSMPRRFGERSDGLEPIARGGRQHAVE